MVKKVKWKKVLPTYHTYFFGDISENKQLFLAFNNNISKNISDLYWTYPRPTHRQVWI